jgi:hypothetical protein
MENFGILTPQGGGDPIPLYKKTLLVGRRESCDVVLRFANVSAHHCKLSVVEGYWQVHDMNSRNGVKINGVRVTEKRIMPGDIISVAKHRYRLTYSPIDLGAVGPLPPDDHATRIFGKSLLERAGLNQKAAENAKQHPHDKSAKRYNIDD